MAHIKPTYNIQSLLYFKTKIQISETDYDAQHTPNLAARGHLKSVTNLPGYCDQASGKWEIGLTNRRNERKANPKSMAFYVKRVGKCHHVHRDVSRV